MSGIRKHANVVALLALFIALGGSAYAAVQLTKNSVRSKHIKNGQVKRPDLAKNAVTGAKVADGTLLSDDFAPGQLPQGPQGPKGDTGTVDTSNFFTKAQSDERFLGITGKAADADLLDERDSSGFAWLAPEVAQEPAPSVAGSPALWLRPTATVGGSSYPTEFKVLNDGGFVAKGELGVGPIPATGPGYRMMWYPFKAAFRAGGTDDGGAGTFWDDANVGFYSWAGGNQTKASAFAAFAFGDQSTASGVDAVAFGGASLASGTASFVSGASSKAEGFGSTAMGFTNRADGQGAVALGYRVGAIGDYSVALGHRAVTGTCANPSSCNLDTVTSPRHGAFVFGDQSTTTSIEATANNQFSVRAAGGVRLFTNATLTTGCSLAGGSGTWSCSSDRRVKRDIEDVDTGDVLRRLAKIPVKKWSYKSQDPSVRHIGPMAQDFRSAYGLGIDERHIDTVDADGVALASIQALYRISQRQQRQLDRQAAELRSLRRLLARKGG